MHQNAALCGNGLRVGNVQLKASQTNPRLWLKGFGFVWERAKNTEEKGKKMLVTSNFLIFQQFLSKGFFIWDVTTTDCQVYAKGLC